MKEHDKRQDRFKNGFGAFFKNNFMLRDIHKLFQNSSLVCWLTGIYGKRAAYFVILQGGFSTA